MSAIPSNPAPLTREQSHRKVMEMIAAYAQRRAESRQQTRICLVGKWDQPALGLLQELELDLLLQPIFTSVVQGTFDVLAVTDDNTDALVRALPHLEPSALVLSEISAATTAAWKSALSEHAFHDIKARSDRSAQQVAHRDIILAKAPIKQVRPSVAAPVDPRAHQEIIKDVLGTLLQIPTDQLDVTSAFSEFGVDSIGAVALAKELNRRLGTELKPTVLFDYGTIEKLAIHTVRQSPVMPVTVPKQEQPVAARYERRPPAPPIAETDIAIIGMSGRFPLAGNTHEFWQNLSKGRNCITEVPSNRWDHAKIFAARGDQKNKTCSKWGGFLDDFDKFDPLFFNISGREAEATDPQHRLFLEECYHALEDAGYAGSSLSSAKKCGVFVGVEPGDYLGLVLNGDWPQENTPVFQGNAESILAARISYFLDLKGPSVAINTACSSSLVAIHLACRSLLGGDCDLALAGGVRLFTSEKGYLALGNMGMLSPEGKCKTFDEGADGFAPGEAVGVVVLKGLEAALRDNDQILGVIKGSAINQDGKTNGITAPSSLSQTQVQLEVYEKFGINPETIQYVEAHGTGTKLGDPIEVQALTQSFRQFTSLKQFCSIGSVKTNIGHTMAAAGVCSVIKVLLALRQKQIPPSLNLRKANPYIDFEQSPFRVITDLANWTPQNGQLRRAAISSFGFSGTNCHLILEEPPATTPAPTSRPAYLLTLSAKTEEALQRRIEDLHQTITANSLTLADVSFSLNHGRAHFPHRCAIVASSLPEFVSALNALRENETPSNVFVSDQKANRSKEESLRNDIVTFILKDLQSHQHVAATYREKLSSLAGCYVQGANIDWNLLHRDDGARKVSLPGYPFARERYWVEVAPSPVEVHSARIHPLVHRNSSTLGQTQFSSRLSRNDFFLADHEINGVKVLPGVSYLEMAAVAFREASHTSQVTLTDVTWLRPLPVRDVEEITINLKPVASGAEFEIRGSGANTIFARGKVGPGSEFTPEILDLDSIRKRCMAREGSRNLYDRCVSAGLKLGPSLATIRNIQFSSTEALAHLLLPASALAEAERFTLHPGIFDGAFQTTAVLGSKSNEFLPVPFAIEQVSFNRLPTDCYAYVQLRSDDAQGRRFDIQIVSESGLVLARLKNLIMRPLRTQPAQGRSETVVLKPAWRDELLSVASASPAGKLWLFDESSELHHHLTTHFPSVNVIRICRGSEFRTENSLVHIQPGNPDHYQRLLGSGAPIYIIHRWATSAISTDEALERGVISLFHISKAFIQERIQSRVQCLFVHSPKSDPAATAVSGFARVLNLERPAFALKIFATANPNDSAAIIRELLDSRDSIVRQIGETRQVPELKPCALPQSSVPVLRENGVYVITGGLGGLGTILAKHLLEKYGARVALWGRSTPGADLEKRLSSLSGSHHEVAYFQVDLCNPEAVTQALTETKSRFGKVDGVVHAAGLLRDGFLLTKTVQQFNEVLAPKVRGTLNLHHAFAGESLDFLLLFSSVSAILGNAGQSDYAYANAFLDEFALWREDLRSQGRCAGRTISINWPLWREGGMQQTEDVQRLKLSEHGLTLLESSAGLKLFENILASEESRIVALAGDPDRIQKLINPSKEAPPVSKPRRASTPGDLQSPILAYLREKFAALVKLPVARIQPSEPLEKYGIDSIMVMEFTQRLEADFGQLSKTLLFEHQNLEDLAQYFLTEHSEKIRELCQPQPEHLADAPTPQNAPAVAAVYDRRPLEVPHVQPPRPPSAAPDPIAIIGLSGRFPMADDLEQFWQNLRDGRDCIQEIPRERWNYKLFYDSEPGKLGKTINKWGGFLSNVEKFDAEFFSITPREAIALDPQERLFLQTVWGTVEDAGYRKKILSGKRIGVFVGVMYGEYQLYGAGNATGGNVFPLSSSYASIANRVSYFFNWHGPSIALDTMCSSSLTSIHLACESIRRGESELAIAGGVNTSVHPHKDILLAPGGFAAADGRCRSFGEGGTGYVPGEGVGAVLLKSLSQALADDDHIYGIIKGSSVNHGGKTNGYTVPNPKAQAELIRDALAASGLSAGELNYIEAHGTGTSLGDPIEITALKKAFQESGGAEIHCPVGSVKSNIGHLESAAGIAGVTKVLLQMQHRELVPSLHSTRLNPNLHLEGTGFRIQQSVEPWADPILRAGVSSFGAGGANAHVILEEFVKAPPARHADGPCLIILSAKTEDRLRAKAAQLQRYLSNGRASSLGAVAYTLQVGREAFAERLCFLASNPEEASSLLQKYVSGEVSPALVRGTVRDGKPDSVAWLDDHDRASLLESMVRHRKWDALGRFWIAGGEIDWDSLYPDNRPRRIPLPTYPFAGERYWAPDHILKTVPTPTPELVSAHSEALYFKPIWKSRVSTPTPTLRLLGRLALLNIDPELASEIGVHHPDLALLPISTSSPQWTESDRPDYLLFAWPGQTVNGMGQGITSLYHILRSLLARPLTKPIRFLVVSTKKDPSFEALPAFAKSIFQEQPNLLLHTLITDKLDALVLQHFHAGTTPQALRRNGSAIEIQSFEQLIGTAPRSIAFRQRATYLITGGLGGVGLIFAKHLLSQYGANVILLGRSELSGSLLERFGHLNSIGGAVLYFRCDASKPEELGTTLAEARQKFGPLNGVIHAAGTLRDGFVIKKDLQTFLSVLTPKINGVEALDAATTSDPLDFFALFSSTASVFGNAGQSDYAYANAYLDAFAAQRQTRRAPGLTVSINWPLWADGGMKLPAAALEAIRETGLEPLPPSVGLNLFETILNLGEPQVLPLWGNREKLLQRFAAPEIQTEASHPATVIVSANFTEQVEEYLRRALAEVTQIPFDRVDPLKRFEDIGIDSIVVGAFNQKLAKEVGALPKTLLFEFPNVRELSLHAAKAHQNEFAAFLNPAAPALAAVYDRRPAVAAVYDRRPSDAAPAPSTPLLPAEHEPIAIIGLAGRYPSAPDINAFWENLKSGKDCVSIVPEERWDAEKFFDSDPAKAGEGRIYSKWGAFVDDVDKFDPLFFNIAPVEAELMDPQERLFLQTAWHALEDAGYTREELVRSVRPGYRSNVGVFVGVTTNTYAAVARDNGGERFLPVSLPWSIANRVSFLFNFNGPSMPVDTACSSSLTAIHLACESLRKGECQQAIAGGVNLYLHPSKYVSLCIMRMLSSKGQCRTFGEGGDGFVPGEGVGAVLLKPLSLAQADGDQIYAVIRGTAVNHGGRTNGYTVPSPAAQAELIQQALENGRTSPDSISYIEAHGTGTALGDPIEIEGLTRALTQTAPSTCHVGSVKSNVGHLEAAAGIAGLTKVLLQLKHRQLAPSLHAEPLNPNISLGAFRIPTKLESWVANGPLRRAGLSSFGAGGANAHIIVEEFQNTPIRNVGVSSILFVLSAKNRERLQHHARAVHDFISRTNDSEAPLSSIAFTLQTGREHFEERIAFMAASRDELLSSLAEIAETQTFSPGIVHRRLKKEEILRHAQVLRLEPFAFATALKAWIEGQSVDWRAVWGPELPSRIHLPGYPFARDHYWVPKLAPLPAQSSPPLHPLVHSNDSTFAQQLYTTRLAPVDFVLNDHRVAGQSVLPGAATLEMALTALHLAMKSPHIRLRDVTWVSPLEATNGSLDLSVRLDLEANGKSRFTISSAENLKVQGRAEIESAFSAEFVDLTSLLARCPKTIPAADLYTGFKARGLDYGPGFRVLREIHFSDQEVYAKLQLPTCWSGHSYRLHPALVDGALQSLAVLGAGDSGLEIPFAVSEVECGGTLPELCFVYARIESTEGNLRRYEIKLVAQTGEVLARLRGLSVRRYGAPQSELLYYETVWQDNPLISSLELTGTILHFTNSPTEASVPAAVYDRRPPSSTHHRITVTPGDAYNLTGNTATIRISEPSDYERLIRETNPQYIIHNWSRADLPIDDALTCGIYSLHYLTQALLKNSVQSERTLLYAYPQADPLHAGASGYLRSAMHEDRKLTCKIAGIETTENLFSELPSSDTEVRYIGGKRQTKTLRPLASTAAQSPPPSGAVFLITGGAGALGRALTHHLIRKYNASILSVGRSELSAEKQTWIASLKNKAHYFPCDISSLAGAETALAHARKLFGKVDWIIHAAGELHDSLIRNKTREQFERVIASKLRGALSLDEAAARENLQGLIVFSSTAGVLGNAGQSDYAYANAFLDAWAARRHGRTLSLAWPLWEQGGMTANPSAISAQADKLGLQPLPTAAGLEAFDRALLLNTPQCTIFYGNRAQLEKQLQTPTPAVAPKPVAALATSTISRTVLLTELKRITASVLRLDAQVLEDDVEMSDYGFDSITLTTLSNELNKALDLDVTPATLFEYTTLDKFAGYLLQQHTSKLTAHFGTAPEPITPAPAPPAAQPRPSTKVPSTRTREPIAIVGISGVFPGSPDLDTFWQNLEAGKDLISRAPRDRWKFSGSSHSQAGSLEAPWGGFLENIDKFDPLFFDISPREAELMDPQQRLFLETVWHAIEDSGHKVSEFAGTRTGLFVGVAANDYANLLALAGVPVEAYSSTGNSHSVLANRVSFLLDLHGPSEAIDTACSSSLVAIHRAIESIQCGSSDMAIVGGVNVLLTPGAFLSFGKAGMLCEDGRCKTFDAKANGYVRGEGVGAILLKPLTQAERDGDHIYALITGTAENHGGHVQSLTVPNPTAQASLIQDACRRAEVDPFTIGYIEAHGTGTSLGDPIEINGLKKAFGQNTSDIPLPRCAVGAVKTNIGHLETAAGIAGIIKVLLSLQKKIIPGNVHLQNLNPYIQLENSPFWFPKESLPWKALRDVNGHAIPRRAGISSFGFGGANAHVLLEEYSEKSATVTPDRQLVLLSAKAPDRLSEAAQQLLQKLELNPTLSLAEISYTLQIGRDHMEERVAFEVANIAELKSALANLAKGEAVPAFAGNTATQKESLRLLRELHTDDSYLAPLLRERNLSKLARLWIAGLSIPWEQLWSGQAPSRVSLPGYPFARQRCWVPESSPAQSTAPASRLHPLIHTNRSTLQEQAYESTFTLDDPILRDHRVAGKSVLPGAATLEMARAAVQLAAGTDHIRLRDVAWLKPLSGHAGTLHCAIALHPQNDGSIKFFIRSDELSVQGKADCTPATPLDRIDLSDVRARCTSRRTSSELYSSFEQHGLNYGPGFQVIQHADCNEREVLTELALPDTWANEQFDLHPALVDGAFQSLALIGSKSGELQVPFAVANVTCFAPLPPRCFVYARLADTGYDATILNGDGTVLAQLAGIAVRRFANENPEPLYYRPVWEPRDLQAPVSTLTGTVLLFERKNPLPWQNLGLKIIQVIPGAAYERRRGDVIEIRPDAEEDYQRLVAEEAFDHIIHQWSERDLRFADALRLGVYSIHHLSRALLKQSKRPQKLLYVYPRGEAVFEGLGGYAKSLLQEQPELKWLTVGIDSVQNPSAELAQDDLEIRYTNGHREVRTLQEFVPSAAPANLPPGAVYLITGGTGGLGRLFAEHLVREKAGKVILAGRSELTSEKQAWLNEFSGEIIYARADLGERTDVEAVLKTAKATFGKIDWIIHAAGELKDGLIWNKEAGEMAPVIRAKLQTLLTLDEVTQNEKLQGFIIFSSTAGLLGNAGQSDYAYANAAADAFAWRRETLREKGQREGRTITINWPLWSAGGMKGKSGRAEALGLVSLTRETGLALFETILASNETQVWGCLGKRDKIKSVLLAPAPQRVATESTDDVVEFLVTEFAALTKIVPAQIKLDQPFEKYGFDSIMAIEFSERLEKRFGALSKTLVFEYQTIATLAGYLSSKATTIEASRPVAAVYDRRPLPPTRFLTSNTDRGIAIIGVSGRYPKSENLDEFWQNLVAGKDCIEEIPIDRWDYRQFYNPDPKTPGKSTNKFGGFIKDFDKFDPLFFNISPREAEIIDPQERIFLENVWNTVENSGYSRTALDGRKVAVFVGVMYGQYQLYGVEESQRRGEVLTLSSSYASIANRVSYFFNWRGPCTAIDSMCSSSLMSIHLACESLRRGESEYAIAGGVNLILHPHKDLGLSQAGFINPEGKSRSYGETSARGYVAGEGVGSVLLKPLSKAIADGDHIYAVIKGVAVNHGGKGTAYAIPSPAAQAEVIDSALKDAGIDPRTISYIEGAATGSALSDPIEVEALNRALQGVAKCVLGSVKSNIGHLESASGIAGLTKILLQLEHNQIAPSLHSEQLNSRIPWSQTPFSVPQKPEPWIASDGQPRRAGLSAFGAGGSNAHVIVEEFHSPVPTAASTEPQILILSGRDREALKRRTQTLAISLRATKSSLAAIAYTLQIGREQMEERLAFICSDLTEAIAKLDAFLLGAKDSMEIYTGTAQDRIPLTSDTKLAALAQHWVKGGLVDWQKLHSGKTLRRVPLPGYSFARDRYWFTQQAPKTQAQPSTIVSALRSTLAEILKMPADQIQSGKRMLDYGLDSMTAVTFLDRVNQKHRLQLTPANLLEHPTLDALASLAGSLPAPVLKRRRRILPLTPADYLFVGPRRLPIQVVYYFKQGLDFTHLQRGLHKLSDLFFPLNSRLSSPTRRELAFKEAADAPDFAEVICTDSTAAPSLHDPASWAPFQVAFHPDKPNEKQARFRLFQLKEGSVLSANVSHAIADGFSFYYLLSAWASLCRGESIIAPDHGRRALNRIIARFRDRDLSVQPGLLDTSETNPEPADRMETILLEPDSLLREAALAVEARHRDKLTENSVVTAYIWKRYAQALGSEFSELVLSCPIDFRRLSSHLSPTFFGNAVLPAITRLPSAQVLDSRLGDLAALIYDSIHSCDEEMFLRYCAGLDHIRRNSGVTGPQKVSLVNAKNGLIVTNVSRFPHAPLDFGNGSYAEEYAPVHYGGTAVIVSAPNNMLKVRLALPRLPARTETSTPDDKQLAAS